ncbi:MAG: FAD-binding oxidoreductase [Desulfobacterota bacterium]|nr:FAD-binding oxidoreductase [Thermodesulfobacteriota bacterium]
MKQVAEVVIIGGGIIGVSIAYYLSQRRPGRILLLEKGQLGGGSTSRCVGGIRTQFSTEINILFSLESMKTFDHFEEEFGVDPEFRKVGYLFLATTEPETEVFRQNMALQKRYGIPVEWWEPEEIRRRCPYLRTEDVLGGTFCALDGYAGPSEVLTGFAKGARREGVEIWEGEEVKAVIIERGEVKGVRSDRHEISAPVVVNAGGPYAALIGEMAGLKIPVTPLRRQVFVTAPFHLTDQPIPLTIDFHRGWYFRRELDGFLLSGPLDQTPSFNTETDYEALVEASENAIFRVPAFERASIARGWAGLYEISPDHHAILGEVPGLKGFILANGFSGHGFQHSPAVGKVIAELITEGRTTTLDISPLSIERFEKGEILLEPMTAFRD